MAVKANNLMELSCKEKNLIAELITRLRKVPYGEFHTIIIMQAKEPVRIVIKKDTEESIKL